MGIDMGLEFYAATSDREIIDNPRWFRAAQMGLRRKQRHAARCVKGSSGWRRACEWVATLHRHVFHQRHDFQHKMSRELVNRYRFIAVEDLKVKELAGGRLAKSVQDAAWSSFIRKLSYKAESADRQLVKVDARGTSQQCPCGAPVPKKLWDRKHHCTVCGLNTTRDHASALEILRRGLCLRTTMPAIASMALEAPAFRHGPVSLYPHSFAIRGHIFIVFFKAPGKAVMALGVGDEVVKIAWDRVHRGFEGAASGIADRSGRQAGIAVGVIGRTELYIRMM